MEAEDSSQSASTYLPMHMVILGGLLRDVIGIKNIWRRIGGRYLNYELEGI
jgi:hypothetical protein